MSRERAAACPLGAAELPLLGLARMIPERSLLELRAEAGRVGSPSRRAFLHLAACETCAGETLCQRGAGYVAQARGWRPRAGAKSGAGR